MSAEETARAIPIWRKCLYAVVPAVVLLGMLETGARVWEWRSPTLPADLGLGFDADSRLFVPDPEDAAWLVTNPAKLGFFHAQRFAAKKAEGVLRVAVLGESSVNFLHAELQQLRERLKAGLPGAKDVEVINAGGSSHGSERLLIIARELVQYDLDLMVAYLGNNEFEEITHKQLVQPSRLPLQRALDRTALGRRARHMLAARELKGYQQQGGRIDFLRLAMENVGSFTDIPTEAASARMALFEKTLEAMVVACREAGVPVMMATIPSNHWEPTWYSLEQNEKHQHRWRPMRERGEYGPYYQEVRESLRLHPRVQASDAENEIITAAAARHGIEMVDMRAAVERAEPHGIPGETLFADNCHLNEAGKQLWLDTFEPRIASALRDDWR